MDFSVKNLAAALAGKRLGCPLYFRDVTDSTNNEAFRLAVQGAGEGTAVVADRQTAGKGRMHREWESPPGRNLYVSLILRPELKPLLAPSLALMAGVAVADMLTTYCPGGVHLKWPNDVYVQDKKIAGILSESKIVGSKIQFIVLGIGVNVNISKGDFTPSLQSIATSVKEETGHDVSRLAMTVRLFDAVNRYYDHLLMEGFGVIRTEWLALTRMIGRYCEVMSGGERYRGKILDIDERGALMIMTEEGTVCRILAGDASLIKEP
jgi:BirA family transcriptional regulator, biotin operon repressor / biotin---[acetyl-CoA-carboxylase] ligase